MNEVKLEKLVYLSAYAYRTEMRNCYYNPLQFASYFPNFKFCSHFSVRTEQGNWVHPITHFTFTFELYFSEN